MRSYFQHGSRHAPTGSDPIPGLASGTGNDWVIGQTALGTVSSGVQVFGSMFILYQTDGGSIFGTGTSGPYNTVTMLQVGTYLVRARVSYPKGHAGTVQTGAVIGGDVTTYDYFTAAGLIGYVDSSTGEAIWEQLCVVNDLSAPAGAYVSFEHTTGINLVGCVGQIQIFRLT